MEQSVFQVAGDPGSRSGAGREVAGRAQVDCVHVAATGIGDLRLDVAVVETAPVVDVGAAGHHVHAFRLSVSRHPGPDVMPVTRLPGDVDPVDAVSAGDDRQRSGVGTDVTTARAAVRLDGQVVVLGRLIVDCGDHASGACAEPVLSVGVGVPAGSQRADVRRRLVGHTSHLVQASAVSGVKRPHRAVCCYARRTGACVDVAWQLRCRGTAADTDNPS